MLPDIGKARPTVVRRRSTLANFGTNSANFARPNNLKERRGSDELLGTGLCTLHKKGAHKPWAPPNHGRVRPHIGELG